MNAVVPTRTITVPRGASTIERASIRLAGAMTRWAMRRAERREDRRERMLVAIQEQQTRKIDPHATDHLLAPLGVRRR
ncbi:hypothetical protein [Microbacterium sp. EST19A]|uniref:hypothetical protein n=1 Tax=Microbacterium sp. EST19A TaxID=2862681 RepID=UPI001CBF060F|nr:hypothetical protein [Microbacterium sp. EST19A]